LDTKQYKLDDAQCAVAVVSTDAESSFIACRLGCWEYWVYGMQQHSLWL